MSTPMSPERAARQRRVMRVLNVPMRAILVLPFRTPLSSRLMLVFHVGRRTGKTYRQPLSYVRDGDVLLTPGGGRWTRNLVAGSPVRARIGGRDVQLRAELVDEPETVARLLDVMAKHNPAIRRFVPLPRASDGTLEPEPLRNAVRHGFCVVRWHSLPESPTPRP